MNTPSLPFRKALIMNSGSTRPVHMSRIFRIYGIYCSLETPAKSAAEYPHQLQRKPRTLGLNSNPALIRIPPPPSVNSRLHWRSAYLLYFLQLRNRGVDLGQHLFVRIVLQVDGPGRALGVTEAIPLAKDGVYADLVTLSRLVQLYGPVGAGRHASSAPYTLTLVHLAHGAGSSNGVLGKQGHGPSGCTVGLTDGLRYMFRMMRRPAQEYTIGAKVHGPQLHVGLLEETVRARGGLELLGSLLGSRRGNHGGGQPDRVGLDFQPLAQDGIGNGNIQATSAILAHSFYLRLVVRLITDELHALVGRFPVVVLTEPVGSHVPEEDVDFHFRVGLLQFQSVLDGLATADAGAIVPVFLPATNTLDHVQTAALGKPLFSRGDPFLQLQLGDYPIVLTVQVLSGLVLLSAGGDDSRPMVYLFSSAFRLHRSGEIADVPSDLSDGGVRRHMNQGVLINISNEALQISLNVQPFQSVMLSPGHAPQILILLHQVNIEPLVGQAEGAGHAGHTAAHHQAGVVHRLIVLLVV